VLPKSVTPARIEENLRVVNLHDADIKALDDIHRVRGVKRFVYPPFGVDLGVPDKQ
jgi:glycerol 2-dehydrogenase (NADP+)